MTDEIKVKQPKKRKSASLDKKKARGGWLFVAPFVIGFVLVYLPIFIDSIRLSFCESIPQDGGGVVYKFVGWQNYNDALFGANGSTFVQKLLDGVTNMVFDIPMILIFSLFMAVLLNQKMPGRAVFRAIFFIPVIISTGILETIEAGNVFAEAQESGGVDDGTSAASGDMTSSTVMSVESLLSGMVVGQGLVEYVAQAITNIFNIVNRSGVQMLIFLAGLQSISPAIYESVQIDGATSWETFWKITFPMISPMILVNAVYTVIDSFTTKSNVVMVYISEIWAQPHGGELSSAMSWMYFLVVVLILAIVASIFSAFVFYQRKD